MTYGQIRLRIAQLLPGVSLDLIDGWMRDRYFEILDALAWKRRDAIADVETGAGVRVYALPADCRAVKSITSAQRGRLSDQWQTWMTVSTVPGPPSAWRLTIDTESDPPLQQIELHPTPIGEETLTVEYTAEDAAFGEGVTLLPWVREGCLVAGVEADGLAHLKEHAASDRKAVRFEKLLADMRRTDATSRPRKALRLSPRFSARRWTGDWRA